MKFDAISEKTREKKETPRKVQQIIKRINKVYPVIGITKQEYTHTKCYFEEYAMYLEVQSQDLNYLTEKEANDVIESYWKMHKNYGSSLKEIYLAFPENNRKQQDYFIHKIERTTNPKIMKYLTQELDKLKYIEENFVTEESYMVIYARSIFELEKNYEYLRKAGNELFQFNPFSEEKLTKLLNIMNNTGGIWDEDIE